MKQSQLFPNDALKEIPKDEESLNAQLLIRGGFIDKEMAGVYTYLPLGWRVIKKIEQIIREEMNSVNGQEILMPALQAKRRWEDTDRYHAMHSILYEVFDQHTSTRNLLLGPTHEEIITPLAQKHVFSYKDLPLAVYQFQVKFRNELRARSGLLRGREFLMKDLYSFHADEKDLDKYYKEVARAYEKIWKRVNIHQQTVKTFASGGDFSKYSHEFQTMIESGEDIIYYCDKCNLAVNKEIIEDVDKECPDCQNTKLVEKKSIEVGNIFKLKAKFSNAKNIQFKFTDENGENHPVIMASYGIGLGRLMATIVEVHYDEKGIVWPRSVTPYHAHLLNLKKDSSDANTLYEALQKKGFSILYDDREISAGGKFAEADLLGISVRLVISEKTDKQIEWKERAKKDVELLSEDELTKRLEKYYYSVK